MNKSKIFIASSGRTLTLAEKLQESLQTEYSEATLWTEESRRQPGANIIEMLKAAANTYDFAVILLANDDLVAREGADTPKTKARDNCVFEAGLFIAALGRDRCFLVNGVNVGNLPTDLGGIITLPFDEPQTADLSNREACERAIHSVSFDVQGVVRRLGRLPNRRSVPLLSIGDVASRERPKEMEATCKTKVKKGWLSCAICSPLRIQSWLHRFGATSDTGFVTSTSFMDAKTRLTGSARRSRSFQ